jgi:uncharacterized membrane protein YbhN (UPF0104 family)
VADRANIRPSKYRPPGPASVLSWIHRNARVQLVIPLAIALGLLGYVLSVAVAPRSGTELVAIVQHTWLPILILTFPYLLARAVVWYELLRQLNLKVPWRQLAAAFAVGEMTKSIPAGVYTQNYLLSRLGHFNQLSAVRSTMATTAMLGLETAVAVPVAVIVGLPGAEWARWTLLAIVIAWLIVMMLAWMVTHFWEHHLSPRSHPWLLAGARLAAEFLEAGAELVSLRTILALLPTILYMLIYAVYLQLIIHAAAVNMPFGHTVVVYAFIVLAVVLVPIPTELGITEFTGMGGLLAYGIPASTAAVIMLAMRLLATGMTLVVAGTVLFLTRDELREAKRGATPAQPARASE